MRVGRIKKIINIWRNGLRQKTYDILDGKGFKTIRCLGDSHAEIFGYIEERKLLKRTRLLSCVVAGATAMGLANPNSKTEALSIFKNYLEEINENHTVLFLLGEVDCGYLIWYWSQEGEQDFEELYLKSLRNYTAIIEYLLGMKHHNIIICSVPLPTILDGQNWGEVADMRKIVKANIEERTALTKRYNKYLKKYCSRRSIKYLDYEEDILDENNGIVDEYFMNDDPLDHHFNSKNFAPVIIRKLNELGYR